MNRTLNGVLNDLEKARIRIENEIEKKKEERSSKREKSELILKKINSNQEQNKNKLMEQSQRNIMLIKQSEKEIVNLMEDLVKCELDAECTDLSRLEKEVSSKTHTLNELRAKQKVYDKLLERKLTLSSKEKREVKKAIELFSDTQRFDPDFFEANKALENAKNVIRTLEDLIKENNKSYLNKKQIDYHVISFVDKYLNVKPLLNGKFKDYGVWSEGTAQNEVLKNWLNDNTEDFSVFVSSTLGVANESK